MELKIFKVNGEWWEDEVNIRCTYLLGYRPMHTALGKANVHAPYEVCNAGVRELSAAHVAA